jgi:hypothetical protein
MADVSRAFHKVRRELAEVGLLANGVFLDEVELHISPFPSEGEVGYVFEDIGNWDKLGYQPGIIYLPKDLPHDPYLPGHTLTDTIRHEFAHAWHYMDPKFFRDAWFVNTFGAPYSSCHPRPLREWTRELKQDRKYMREKDRCRTDEAADRIFEQRKRLQFITEYASTCACEDFAETFMFYLRYRNSLDRFKPRPQVYRKLKSVERAVARASRRIGIEPTSRWQLRSA